MGEIKLRRAYDEKGKDDGYRMLVDRLWPRGIKKEELVATVQTKVNENISKYGLAIEPLVVDGIVGRKTLLALINVLSR